METDLDNRFRLELEAEFVKRTRRNPAYSLRAYARQLGIGAPALSEILRGKRACGVKLRKRLAKELGLGPGPIRAGETYALIEADQFALISDWYHYAILELLKLEDFQPSTQWVARQLGLSRPLVRAAVDRLVRLGLLAIRADGKWEDRSGGASTNIIDPEISSAGARQLQKQILEQALEALSETPAAQRNQTSMTMAIDPADLPYAIERIAEFRRNLCSELTRRPKKKAVYQLSISIFPVSKVQSKEKGKQREE